MDKLLINIEDVRKYRDIDPKYDQDKFNGFLRDIQRRNLRDLLGPALYRDFMENSTSTKYANLLNGTNYEYDGDTIDYYGLIPVLVYWILAKMTREGGLYNANYGPVEFVDNPQQNFQTAKMKESTAQDYMISASEYENEVIRFLDEHNTTYTLWEYKKQSSGTQFVTFKLN